MSDDPQLNLPSRDVSEMWWKRSARLRIPNIDTGSQAQVDADAKIMADNVAPLYANSKKIFNNTSRQTKRGKALDLEGLSVGEERRLATPAVGFVSIKAVAAGVRIPAKTPGTIQSVQYRTVEDQVYFDGDRVLVEAVETGTGGNAEPGAIFNWSSPPLGLTDQATVFRQGTGLGLSGGAPDESDEEYLARLNELSAEPAASGNEAEYCDAILDTPKIPVAQGFVYPGIDGAGTTAVTAVLRPDFPGSSRIPTSEDLDAFLAHFRGLFPASDVPLMCPLVASPVDVAFTVRWSRRGKTWADQVPWPAYNATPVAVSGSSTPTESACRVRDVILAPQVGQSIAFFDTSVDADGKPQNKFRRKLIATVTNIGAAVWALTFDLTTNLSDPSYIPVVDQLVCPWSDSLDLMAAPIVAEFDTLGPGEQVASPWDPGIRQRRYPSSDDAYPSVLGVRSFKALDDVGALADWDLALPVAPYSTPVGTAGTFSYQLTLRSIGAYPQ